jgi:hypothetical protein
VWSLTTRVRVRFEGTGVTVRRGWLLGRSRARIEAERLG